MPHVRVAILGPSSERLVSFFTQERFMQQDSYPVTTDLVLVGGGHSHAIALKMFAMNPLPGVRITLITDTTHTPYSGMLPGHVAGFYDYDETHIDLRRLAVFAKAQLYLDQAIGLVLPENKVICANHPPVAFDILSIDIGSTPATASTPGASKFAIPAKPVPVFLNAWDQITTQVAQNPSQPLTLGIVGGGAGGVELALNIQAKLHPILARSNQSPETLKLHLFHRKHRLLPQHNRTVSRQLETILLRRKVQIHWNETVSQIAEQTTPSQGLKVSCESGLDVDCHHVFWVTQASAPKWIETSGLATDQRGFILVNDTLQSVSHPHIFATGDIATMQNYQRPKAGVFAVRQGKPLFENLRRMALAKKLLPYRPQSRYLSLIGTGDKQAIASWSFLGWRSPLMWQLKDRIDRKFMETFSDLPSMEVDASQNPNDGRLSPHLSNSFVPDTPPKMHCAGCGSKVGSTILERVIKRLPIIGGPGVVIGLSDPDDAAVLQVPANQLMVQTVDYFRSLIDDPYVFGQIATNHCLSDIFAMGAIPQSALAIVTIPYGTDAKIEETLYQLMSGANKILQDCQTPLIGGHTTEGAELAFGLSCNGLVHPDQLLRKNGMKPGHVLVLTKAIGTGTLFAADMRYQAKGRWIEHALESMLMSSQTAAPVLLDYGATACTDITGFGLLGHLLEMVKASQVGVELDLEAIPVLPGAIETVQTGITSSLHPQNLRMAIYINQAAQASELARYQLLFDPQTSGGLLASIPADNANACIQKLKMLGHQHSCVIGRVTSASDEMPITLNIG